MPEIPQETRRLQSLLTSLIVLSILIIGLVLVIAAYPTILRPIISPATPPIPSLRPSGTATLTPTITLTPTPSRTPRPSFTPTVTPTPTEMLPASITPTPPGPPTLTPAQPVRADPYRFSEWTAEAADRAIELMRDYPNTLINRLRGENDAGYFQAFSYAVLAAQEGLLRFPDAAQANRWQANLAMDRVKVGDPQAGQQYADLIVQALNQGDVQVEELADWFQLLQPDLRLNQVELKPPPGYLNSRLVEIRGPGSAWIWLLETSSGYQAYLLESRFDFTNLPNMRVVISDLTGDGFEEVAIYNETPSTQQLDLPKVYNLGEVPARHLPFPPGVSKAEIGMDYRNNWQIVKNEQGENELQFNLLLYPACPLTVRRTFSWNGQAFEPGVVEYLVEPFPTTFNLCGLLVDHAFAVWGPQAAIQIMEVLLPDWPPAETLDGKPFPADAKDEWRYRLGIYYALLGDREQALDYLNDLVSRPSVPDSSWLEPAKQFLADYKKPEDVYRACVNTELCDPNRAIEFLVDELAGQSGLDPVEFLYQNGVTLRSSGYFDFDQDDTRERWISVRNRPLEKLNFFILADSLDGVKALNVGVVEVDRPNPQVFSLLVQPEPEKPPIVWIDSQIYLKLLRDPDSGQPYLVYVTPSLEFPNRFFQGVAKARQGLFGDMPLDEVLALLKGLESSPGLLCKTTWTCDEYLYLLGLTNELLGNDRAAIDAYLQLWREYSRSPFTILARLRLVGSIVPATATTTLTPTITPTGFFATITPTFPVGFTLTPTPTATQILVSPSPTIPYPVSTPTDYVPPYPVDTPTPTLNPYP